jgi:glutamate-1-semialdehyde 2,1-aminomutase
VNWNAPASSSTDGAIAQSFAASHGVGLHIQGLPVAFHVSFGDANTEVTDYRTLQQLDLTRYQTLSLSLISHGIWVSPRGIWYVSAAHGPEELDATLTRFDKALIDWLNV